MTRQTFTSTLSAMSTTITIVSIGIREHDHAQAVRDVTDEVEWWQQLFSRFRPESTLSRVNAAGGTRIQVDEAFVALLETARDAVIATGGRFNPAILPTLEAHGYDRTFDELQTADMAICTAPGMVSGEDTWMLVEIDRLTRQIRLPHNMRIDFGGIAKGALADRLADRFAHWPGGAISIGGDMCLWGDPPDGDTWRVGIEHPLDPDNDIVTMELNAGARMAIATSSRTKRTWNTASGHVHHLIDPFTGEPIDSSLLAVTVGALSATAAEVVTKNLMVAAAHGTLSRSLLLNCDWAITISDILDMTRINKEAA